MSEASDRVRTLLLRADNQLKKGRDEPARKALIEARAEAQDESVDPAVRALVERRLESLASLGEE